ncbi:copper chaperone PCu(A)C [Caulobacter hibisci]|uniref:Copper chaperone PCu(A)C n=1 Tax=Caulobacter hibisci TaxID=2035993 RepID=A0ABS0SYQ1_9CAUL|nr:copper chaperone PCu(A)C [Caulobacter hibisci]MBI1684767.1 copper chaperone PCu(A)C [Caulobacter hibisci]
MCRLAPLLALLALTPVVAIAAPRGAPVSVREAWARPAQAGMNGAGYMTLVNTGDRPVTLVGAASPVARMVMIHQTAMQGGVASMRGMDEPLVIPAGGSVSFSPGGRHFMLMGLTAGLNLGGRLPLTLVFDDGRRVEARLAVQRNAPRPAVGGLPAPPHRH